jgi:hypothetical protein
MVMLKLKKGPQSMPKASEAFYAEIDMGTFTFSTPSWDARKSVYTIIIASTATVQSDAQYTDLSGSPTIESPDTQTEVFQTLLKTFVTDLLTKDAESKWFSSRLRESSITKRLVHTWEPSETVRPESEWSFPVWRPNLLEISTKGFTIQWVLDSFVKTTPKISERFLPPMSRPDSPTEPHIRHLTIQTSGEEMDGEVDIPFADESRMVNFEKQQQDKSALQEARLRLALAKLKADRLSNTYYQKYGEIPTDEEESEDSDASS